MRRIRATSVVATSVALSLLLGSLGPQARSAEESPTSTGAGPGTPASDPAPQNVTEEKPAPADPTARLRELLAATQAGIDAVVALDPLIAAASGEQRAVLLEQEATRASEARDLLNDLLAEIVQVRKAGVSDEAASRKTAAFLDRVSRWIENQTRRTSAELKRLRTARDTASGEDLPKIQEQLSQANAAYDVLLNARFNTGVAREAMGLDSKKEYARLDELLVERVDERAAQVRVVRKRIVEYTRKASAADEDEAKRLTAKVAQEREILNERVESVRKLSDLLEERGLPFAEYRQLLIEATGQVTVDIFNREVAVGLVQQWWNRAKAWMAENGPAIAFNLVLAGLVLFAAHLGGRLSQRLVRRAVEGAKTPVSRLFQDFLVSTAYRLVLIFGILVALSQIGLEIAPLLAGLGVASFIVGFALQDTLSNFASGMLILAYRPFDVGDVVNAGGVSGRVEAMTLVTTTILTFDNQRLIVPNGKIWGDVITNVTAERVRRVDMTFGISYSDDIDHAERVLRDITSSHPKVLETPEPMIKLHELGDSSVNFIARPWANTVDYWEVYWDVTREVKRRFDAEGISIPFPQREVRVYSDDGRA